MHGDVLFLEVEFLSAEYLLQEIDQCCLARVGRTVEPNDVLLGILAFKQYPVERFETLSMTSIIDKLYGILVLVAWMLLEVYIHGLREGVLLLLSLLQQFMILPQIVEGN